MTDLNPASVRLLQQRLGVPADGVLGPYTLHAALSALGVADAPSEAPAAKLSPSRAALELIKQFEGCRLAAYPDPGSGGDPWTIGWGSTGPGIRKGVTWTQQQADDRLKADVDQFAEKVAALIGGARTAQHQFDALVSFAYNVGEGNLASSTLLKMHKSGDYVGAAAQFGRWNKAAGKAMPGLTRRRAAEAALYQGAA
jgi:GH24 family phage-related lysozyme (muramidase)